MVTLHSHQIAHLYLQVCNNTKWWLATNSLRPHDCFHVLVLEALEHAEMNLRGHTCAQGEGLCWAALPCP